MTDENSETLLSDDNDYKHDTLFYNRHVTLVVHRKKGVYKVSVNNCGLDKQFSFTVVKQKNKQRLAQASEYADDESDD